MIRSKPLRDIAEWKGYLCVGETEEGHLFEHESTSKIIYLQKGNVDRFHARCFLVSVGIVDYGL